MDLGAHRAEAAVITPVRARQVIGHGVGVLGRGRSLCRKAKAKAPTQLQRKHRMHPIEVDHEQVDPETAVLPKHRRVRVAEGGGQTAIIEAVHVDQRTRMDLVVPGVVVAIGLAVKANPDG